MAFLSKSKVTKLRRLNVATHRDLGYFFVTLTIIYCLSGIALNHVNEWNPDFIIKKKKVALSSDFANAEIDDQMVASLSELVGENSYKVYDAPTSDQLKIYYEDASFHIHFEEGYGVYERVMRRPVFFQSNVLHRNSLVGWKWISDTFAFLLIVLSLTGMFVLKGKHGLSGRGKWLVLAGSMPPIIAFIFYEFL